MPNRPLKLTVGEKYKERHFIDKCVNNLFLSFFHFERKKIEFLKKEV
jgi:hypothetical protein